MSRFGTPAVGRLVRSIFVAALLSAGIVTLLSSSPAPLLADDPNTPHTLFIPVVAQPRDSAEDESLALSLVNQKRREAGVPPVGNLGRLDKNCFDHARYMAVNNVLAHEQDPNLPYASANGQDCAEHSNAWLGGSRSKPGWTPEDSIEDWMTSVAHRLWLLYPTTDAVGYGFYTTQSKNRAAAALDVLSQADFSADSTYGGWPVKYPGSRSFVPATRYPITLQWRYFGPKPTITSTSLRVVDGQAIAHDATTLLPVNHKGIKIVPREDLPANSKFVVTVNGKYDGRTFSFSWQFNTGS
jgi:uncharacterized protein YkwD